jgi:hypothetical protein
MQKTVAFREFVNLQKTKFCLFGKKFLSYYLVIQSLRAKISCLRMIAVKMKSAKVLFRAS